VGGYTTSKQSGEAGEVKEDEGGYNAPEEGGGGKEVEEDAREVAQAQTEAAVAKDLRLNVDAGWRHVRDTGSDALPSTGSLGGQHAAAAASSPAPQHEEPAMEPVSEVAVATAVGMHAAAAAATATAARADASEAFDSLAEVAGSTDGISYVRRSATAEEGKGGTRREITWGASSSVGGGALTLQPVPWRTAWTLVATGGLGVCAAQAAAAVCCMVGRRMRERRARHRGIPAPSPWPAEGRKYSDH
jgi:hypothetical protein